MKRIALVLPYFGKLPEFFQIWLDSCRANPTVDWLLFTDDESPFDYPSNVHREIMTFPALRERIQRAFDFPVQLPLPYKLCDFKCAYGLVFREELAGYDFWGYCDCDLVWGNIRKFVTEAMLEKYDRIFSRGHLTLIRNDAESVRFFMKKAKGVPTYENVLASPDNHSFDEWGGNGTIVAKTESHALFRRNLVRRCFLFEKTLRLLPKSFSQNARRASRRRLFCLERRNADAVFSRRVRRNALRTFSKTSDAHRFRPKGAS